MQANARTAGFDADNLEGHLLFRSVGAMVMNLRDLIAGHIPLRRCGSASVAQDFGKFGMGFVGPQGKSIDIPLGTVR